jgi:hypothetical protein
VSDCSFADALVRNSLCEDKFVSFCGKRDRWRWMFAFSFSSHFCSVVEGSLPKCKRQSVICDCYKQDVKGSGSRKMRTEWERQEKSRPTNNHNRERWRGSTNTNFPLRSSFPDRLQLHFFFWWRWWGARTCHQRNKLTLESIIPMMEMKVKCWKCIRVHTKYLFLYCRQYPYPIPNH